MAGLDLLHLITVVASPEPLTSQADSKSVYWQQGSDLI